MGDFEQGNEDQIATYNSKPRLKTSIVLLLGLFAPVLIMINTWMMGSQILVQSIFWMYNSSPYIYMPSFFGFSLIDAYMLSFMFPFMLLRMVPVTMVYRYYNGKTTRKRAALASFVGDGVFMIMYGPFIFISLIIGMGLGYIVSPLPFQLIITLLILWRSPLPEATRPWDAAPEDKSWWEKEPESREEKQAKPSKKDDDDVLW